ncbi:hypothetical protein C8R45DRAFT_962482 [Mycena sanguinolenta]|nr:hypothetical protein C8R45DRAFT_962482 [Mycena sanguinolenta]
MASASSPHLLTREYLESQHDPINWNSLQLDHLLQILRAHLSVRGRIKSQPEVYEQAIVAILAAEVRVDWKYVVHSAGHPTPVNLKIQEFYQKKLLVLPPEHTHLLNGPPSPVRANSPPTMSDKPRSPSPVPDITVMGGDVRDAPKLLFELIKHDPKVDTKEWQPKVIIANYFGDDDNMVTVTRFNHCDFTGITTYHGVRKSVSNDDNDGDSEDQSPQPEDFETDSIRVAFKTRELLEWIFLSEKVDFPSEADIAYQVTWSIAGYADNVMPYGPYPLYTVVPENTPTAQWVPGINGEHHLPTFGPSKALRVQLAVRPYEEGPKSLTPAQQQTAYIAEYLWKRFGSIDEIKVIRRHNKHHASKHKGVSPARWEDWASTIVAIEDGEDRVSESGFPAEIRGKKVNKTHIAAMLFTSAAWVSDCISLHKQIKKKRLNTGVIKVLADTENIMGIKKLLKIVEGYKD